MQTPVFDALYDAFLSAGYDGISAIEYANEAIREFLASGKRDITWSIGKRTVTVKRNAYSV